MSEKKCIHGKRPSRCADCGGSSICAHRKIFMQCVECKGSQICEHKKFRSICKECRGGSICLHNKQRRWCRLCHPIGWAKGILLLARRAAKIRGHKAPNITPDNLLCLLEKAEYCVLCGEPLDLKVALHLHHDHATGEVFGYAHQLCNQVEGMLRTISPKARKFLISKVTLT